MTRSTCLGLRPQLETLECRTVPATWGVSGSTLTITGDDGNNVIIIHDNGNGDLWVKLDGNELPTSKLRDITRINIDTQGGPDKVIYEQKAGSNPGGGQEGSGNRDRPMTLDVDLGSGSDFFRANILGDILNEGGLLSINVNGQRGHDTIWVDADDDVNIESDATLELVLDGGSGNDDIRSSYEGKLDGLFRANHELGTGEDYLYSAVTVNPDSNGRSGRTWNAEGGNDTIEFLKLRRGYNTWGDPSDRWEDPR